MTRSFRYYDLILGAFVAVLLCSNLIGPAKVVQLDLPFFGQTDFGAGIYSSRYRISSATSSPKSTATRSRAA